MGFVLAFIGAYGVFLVYTAIVYHWRGLGPGPRTVSARQKLSQQAEQWRARAGLRDVGTTELLAVMCVLLVVGAGLAYALFGGIIAPTLTGLFAASFPVAVARSRRDGRIADARESWPRMIEEIRLLTGSLGRSIPHALFEVGRRGPAQMRPAFERAHREWLITTDFGLTIAVLKTELADATADATCETLLVAHDVGGSELDRRLAALVDDRLQDLQGRKDARAKQAGVRFARRFVLLVPLGMTFAGLSIGNGRAAYQTPLGQIAVGVGITVVVLCWLWAGRLMRLPLEQRVLGEAAGDIRSREVSVLR